MMTRITTRMTTSTTTMTSRNEYSVRQFSPSCLQMQVICLGMTLPATFGRHTLTLSLTHTYTHAYHYLYSLFIWTYTLLYFSDAIPYTGTIVLPFVTHNTTTTNNPSNSNALCVLHTLLIGVALHCFLVGSPFSSRSSTHS